VREEATIQVEHSQKELITAAGLKQLSSTDITCFAKMAQIDSKKPKLVAGYAE
jgi:hypothetical protein